MKDETAEPEPTVEPWDEDPNLKQGDTEEKLYRQVWNGETAVDDPQTVRINPRSDEDTIYQTGHETENSCVCDWPLISCLWLYIYWRL